jgi:hypothetical protein
LWDCFKQADACCSLRRLACGGRIALAPDRRRGIQDHLMPPDHAAEEPPNSGEVLAVLRDAAGNLPLLTAKVTE